MVVVLNKHSELRSPNIMGFCICSVQMYQSNFSLYKHSHKEIVNNATSIFIGQEMDIESYPIMDPSLYNYNTTMHPNYYW